MPDENSVPIGDGGESYCEGDENVNWSQVDELASQVDRVNAIEDEGEQIAAARILAAALDAG